MSGSVTLHGAGGGTITVQAGSGDHMFVAQIIANTILLAQDASNLHASQVTINAGVATATPPTVSGQENILYLVGDGDTGGPPGATFNVPAGYDYVIDLLTGPETITGNNVQVIAYDSTGASGAAAGLVSVTGNSSVAADPNDDYNINITGTFNEATGDGNNTITATGSGTIGGGTGTSTYFITPTVPGTGILLQSNGTGDTATIADPSGGDATVQSSANDFTLQSIGLVTIYAALQGDDDTVTGGNADTNVTSGGSHNIVLGGSPGGGAMSYVSNGTGDTIATFGASTVNVSLNGSGSDVGTGDLLIVGSGVANADISGAFETVGGGSSGSATNVTINTIGLSTDELVLGGTGSLSVVDNGTNDTIAPFGASTSSVSLGGSHNLLFAGSNNLTATVGGTNDTIAGGSGPMTITANSSAVIFENTGALNFIGGVGSSSIVGADGTPTAMTVGAGGVTFWSGDNAVTSIKGGLGTTTLLGGSGSSMYFSDTNFTDGGINFSAGFGNETLNASTSTTNDFYGAGANSVGSGSTVFGNDTIVGGSGDDTFTAGGGSDTFTSGTGDNSFVFFASQTDGQHDYITNWTSNDSLFLLGYSNADSASTLMANSTSDGGSLTITLSDSTQITFSNVASTDTEAFNGKIYYG